MATKTLTITEEAYNRLANHKLENESFSEEINRIFSSKSKKNLKDFFGILSSKEGDSILDMLEKKREKNLTLKRKRLS